MIEHFKGWWLLYLILGFVFILIGSQVKRDISFEVKCESQGGYYHKPYRSRPLCLKSKDVIKVIL